MNLVGIVALSVAAALFLFLLLAGAGILIWLALRLKKTQDAAEIETASVHAETKNLLATHQAESKAAIESAKAGFSAIRNETRATLDEQGKAQQTRAAGYEEALTALLAAQRKEIAETLDGFRRQMQVAIDKINAEALTGAAARSIQACLRLEKVASILQQMFTDAEARSTHEYAPEEFAPEENRFGTPPSGYSVSQTARMDEEVDIVAQAEMVTEAVAEV